MLWLKLRFARPGNKPVLPLIVQLWSPVWIVAFLFLAERSSAQCGILLSPIFSNFHILALTLVATSGYWSSCCLSIISNQSAHPPLTSQINQNFLTATAMRENEHENRSKSTVSEIFRWATLSRITRPHSKSLKSFFSELS